jgi:hypothetical protein
MVHFNSNALANNQVVSQTEPDGDLDLAGHRASKTKHGNDRFDPSHEVCGMGGRTEMKFARAALISPKELADIVVRRKQITTLREIR